MTLNKRYLRNIKSNLSFYLCIVLLTMLVMSLYLGFAASYRESKAYLEDVRADAHLEDGQFVTYTPLSDDDMETYKKDYDVDIEKMCYTDLTIEKTVPERATKEEVDTVTLRVFSPTKKINQYIVSEGENLQGADEILINKLFAQRQGLTLGDTITISGKDYKITGYLLRFDYMFCLKNFTDTFSNVDAFGIGVVSETAFEKFPQEDAATYYSIIYHRDNQDEVRKALYEDFQTASYISKENNNRITTADDQMAELDVSVNAIIPIAMVLMVILIAVVLGRKIQNERKMIGVLTALGYKKREMAFHYSLFGAIPGLIGGVLGIALGIPCIEPMGAMMFENKLEPMPVHAMMNVSDIVQAIAFPVLSYTLAVFATAMFVMRGNVVNMIKGLSDKKKRNVMRMRKSRLSFRTKYQVRAILGHLPRTLIVLFGIGLGGILLSFGYACCDSINRYIDESVEEAGSFEYEYFLNTLNTGNPAHGQGMLSASFAVEGYADLLNIMGMDKAEYLKIEDAEGTDFPMKDDAFYISEMASWIYQVGKGDTLTFRDVSSLKEYTVTVDGVFVNGSQSLMVSTRKSVADLFEMPEDAYNLVMSDEKLDYKDSELIQEVKKKEISESLDKNIGKQMRDMMGIIVAFGMLIAIIATFLMVNVLLTESTTVISMLKVLGYHDHEINRIVTHIYHMLLPLAVILGLLGGYLLNKINFEQSVAVYNTYISNYMSLESVVKYIVIIVLSYLISMLLLSRKVKNVSMVESLKNNAE